MYILYNKAIIDCKVMIYLKKIIQNLNLKVFFIAVILLAVLEFMSASIISLDSLNHARRDHHETLILLLILNISMIVIFIAIMFAGLNAFKRMKHFAFYSSTTGLPNRNYILDNLVREIGQGGAVSAIVSLDMDNFKRVNDSLGHLRGDRLLKHAGRRFKLLLNLEDTVCHVGGDEFLFFLKSVKTRDEIEKVAYAIVKSFENPFHIDGVVVDYVTASIGIALIPQDGEDFETVYHHADKAMYCAKHAGKNKYCFYDAGFDKHILDDVG